MDLNYLHFRQQIELMRAKAAACQPARLVHEELASSYGRLIATHLTRRRSLEAA